MFPAALAIVLEAFPVAERGRAMAIFFGIAGGLTSIGPIAGGYLTEWTWRSIFWINIPVALIALFLTWKAKPDDTRHPAKLDYKGTVLVCGGMGLLVLGLQQSAIWGWGDAKTWASIVLGVGILIWFVKDQLGSSNPLLRLRIFENRAFAVDSAVLFFLMIAFVPLFFFASEYAQISLGESASETGLYLLIFFAGFATATQWGGKMLDRIGARRPVVLGCAIGAVGFWLWGSSMTHLSVSEQWYYIVIAGIGVGLVLSPANTDALNRVARSRYGEATGITQTVRNFGSSLGLAILGSLLITWNKSNLESALGAKGVPKDKADAVAECVSQGEATCQKIGQALGSKAGEVFSAVPMSFAEATKDVFHGMAIALAIAFVVALKFMPEARSKKAKSPRTNRARRRLQSNSAPGRRLAPGTREQVATPQRCTLPREAARRLPRPRHAGAAARSRPGGAQAAPKYTPSDGTARSACRHPSRRPKNWPRSTSRSPSCGKRPTRLATPRRSSTSRPASKPCSATPTWCCSTPPKGAAADRRAQGADRRRRSPGCAGPGT